MTTYGLTRDYRYKFYMFIVLFSLFLEYVTYTLWFSKIKVGEQWVFIVQLLLSFISFSTIASVLLLVTDKLYSKLNRINGRYNIKIESSYKGSTIIDATLEIKVGLRKAKIVLKTSTSESNSKTIFIDNQDKDNYKIIYTYHNDGNCFKGKKLVQHDGTCILTFKNKELKDGYYYNGAERKTYGKYLIIREKESSGE